MKVKCKCWCDANREEVFTLFLFSFSFSFPCRMNDDHKKDYPSWCLRESISFLSFYFFLFLFLYIGRNNENAFREMRRHRKTFEEKKIGQ